MNCPRDRHGLSLAVRKRDDGPRHVIDLDAEAGDLLAGPRDRLATRQPPERSRAHRGLAPEEEIAVDRHHRHHGEVLEHRCNAAIEGVLRRAELHDCAIDAQLAGVGPEHAGQDLDERRLAGTIVAEQT